MNYDKKPNLVAISQFMQQYAVNYFKQKGFNVKCEFVLNGIDTDKYQFQHIKSDRILFVGRLSTFKQPHIAIEIARKTNHKLDIIGSATFVDNPEYVNQLDKMVDNDPNIKIYKDADHQFKIEKMQNAKVLIFPSKMNEPAGLVACEAMSCGTPVIAFDDGAIKEYVIDKRTGFICKDINEMIDALNKVHTIDPNECRKRALELSRDIMTKNYEKLYYKLMNGEDW
jgi:glycosyltransferase involved in cell wall biosynthesis